MNRSEFIRLLEKYTRIENRIEKKEGLFELRIEGETINDLNFSAFNLGGTGFCENQFNSCIFHTTNLTITNFCSSIFCNCSFSKNHILKSTWDYVHFIHSTITSMKATKVEFYNIVMQDCEVTDSLFTKCIFDSLLAEWMKEEGVEQGHFSKTVFRNCTFDRCSFENCVFDSVGFIGCTFIDTDIDTMNSGILFTDCRLK